MKLLALQAENAFQHSYLNAKFTNGLIGVLGPNGSGKSNLINAIKYALTGYLSNNKSSCLKYGTNHGYVALDVLCEETQEVFRIRRNLHNGSVYVYQKTGTDFEPISDKASESNEIIEQKVHISKEIADRVLLTPQEDLWALFRMTPADRNKVMQGLLDLNVFPRVREKLRVYLRDTGDFLTRLESQERMLKDQELGKRQYLLSFNDVPPLEVLNQLLISKNSELESVTDQIKAWDTYLFYSERYNAKLEARKGLQALLDANPEPTCTVDNTSESIQSKRDLIAIRLRDLNTQFNALSNYLKDSELEICVSALEDQLQAEVMYQMTVSGKLRDTLDRIKACGTSGTCPTCGAEVHYTDEDLENVQSQYNAACVKRDRAIEALKDEQQRVFDIKTRNKSRLDQLNHLREMLPDVKVFDYVLLDSITALITDEKNKDAIYATKFEKRRNYEIDHQNWERSYGSRKQEIAALDIALSQMEDQLHKPDGESKQVLQEVKSGILKKLEKIHEQRDIRIRMDAAVEELNHIVKEQKRISEQKTAMNPELRTNLVTIQDMIHPSKIPSMIADEIFKVITERMNSYLSEFEAPYSIKMEAGGEFNAIFGSGMIQSATRLSGGEKMILAIAFRLALHSVFASDDMGGFLFLDEPTTFLDDRNKDALVEVLNKLKTSTRFSNLQIFVVTHDEVLRPLFTDVVDLTK